MLELLLATAILVVPVPQPDTNLVGRVTPISILTSGPQVISPADGYNYWFGYYDKFQSDTQDRYVLMQRSTQQNFRPQLQDFVEVGYVDTVEPGSFHTLGHTNAWNWQTGSMLQFIGSSREVIYNTRSSTSGKLIARVIDIDSGKVRELPNPIYSIDQQGKFGYGVNFELLNAARPGYGYASSYELADYSTEDNYLSRVDLYTGRTKDIDLQSVQSRVSGDIKYAIGPLASPSGQLVAFQLRGFTDRGYSPQQLAIGVGDMAFLVWDGDTGRFSDFSDGFTWISHYDWINERQVLVYGRRGNIQSLWEIDITSGRVERRFKEQVRRDTHFTVVSDEILIGDSYPNLAGLMDLFVLNSVTGRRYDLFRFLLPAEFTAEYRVDLHPRISRNRDKIWIDAVENGRRVVKQLEINLPQSTSHNFAHSRDQ